MEKDKDRLPWGVHQHEGFRMLPKQGEPTSKLELCCQTLIKVIAFLPVYTAIVVTIMLYILIFGVPFIKGV